MSTDTNSSAKKTATRAEPQASQTRLYTSASPLTLEQKLTRSIVLGLAPSFLLALYLLWSQSAWSGHARIFISALLLASVLFCLNYLPEKLRAHWRSLSNVIEAVKLGDFSTRAQHGRDPGAYGELVREINQLATQLQQQRLQTLETQTLLSKVIAEIDVAIFAFDHQHRLSLINPAALKLLHREYASVWQKSADELGLAQLLEQPAGVIRHRFAGGDGQWGLRTDTFIEQGRQQRLLFVADLQQVLRAEELKAWQRLIRVLSHEVNNSLTPIASASMSLQTLLQDVDINSHRDDFSDALKMMQERSLRLREFIRRYADWSKLPPPNRRPIVLQELWARLPIWDAQNPVLYSTANERIEIFADPAQLEQALINLLKNAYEAQAGVAAQVECHAVVSGAMVHIEIRDNGPGIGNAGNLFVPFYSTKSDGSGIGLVLCRQIAEAHGGSLSLLNREDGVGAVAELVLPFRGGGAA